MIRQAVHDAVRAQLAAPSDSVAGSLGLRTLTDQLAAVYGAGAVRDLAEELAVDLAEAFAALAAAEGRPALPAFRNAFTRLHSRLSVIRRRTRSITAT